MEFLRNWIRNIGHTFRKLGGGIKAHVASWTLQQTIIASVASFLVVGGAIAGGVAIHHMNNKPAEVVMETESEKESEVATEKKEKVKVTLPTYKDLAVSADSLEKDLTVYFTNASDEKITGTEFAVKLLTAEQYETIKPHIEKLVAYNARINEIKNPEEIAEDSEETNTTESADLVNAGAQADKASTEKDSSASTEKEGSVSTEKESETSTEKQDTKPEKICGMDKEDFETLTELEQQELLKAETIEEYAKALNEIEATRLVDEDKDGQIYQKDLADGDFMMCYEPTESFDAKEYGVAVTVKKKVEYKPVENIQKKVVEYDPSKDEKPEAHEEAAPKAKDTVEFVETSHVDHPAVFEKSAPVIPVAKVVSTKRESLVIEPKLAQQSTEMPLAENDEDEPTPQSEGGSEAGSKDVWFEAPAEINLFSKVANEIEIHLSGLEIETTRCDAANGVTVTKVNEETYKVKASDTADDKTITISFVGIVESHELKINCSVKIKGGNTKLVDANGKALFKDNAGKTPLTYANYEAGKDTYYEAQAAYTTYYGWQTFGRKKYFYDKNGNPVTGNQVIQENNYSFDEKGLLLTGGKGIDVSKWQGTIDWNAAATEISFAIIKCAGRFRDDRDLYIDPMFERNITEAKKVDIQIGLYVYSTAMSEAEAVEEASLAVQLANKYGGVTLPIYFDFEDVTQRDGLTSDQKLAITKAFCETVKKGGYKTGVYSYRYWFAKYMDVNQLPADYSIWVAAPATDTSQPMTIYTGRYDMWQYRVGDGTCAGIKGAVDVNMKYF